MEPVDAHAHVWVIDPKRYPWRPLVTTVTPPVPEAPVEALMAAMTGAGIHQAVVTQPAIYGPDNSYLTEAVGRYPGCLVGVGLIDSLAADAPAQLTYWVQQRGLHGIRLNPGLDRDSRWLSAPQQNELWEAANGLSIPISLRLAPAQLPLLNDMLARFPHVPVVIDYLNPEAFADPPVFTAFDQLAALGRHAQLFAKILPLAGHSREAFPYADLWPAYERLHHAFGARRLIWGSSWPDTRAHFDHKQALAWAQALPFLSASDLEWILGGTAHALWRLPATPTSAANP